MAVCQFFLRGQCRFGDSCRNEHPADGQRQSGFGNQSQTWTNTSSSVNPNNPKNEVLFTSDSIFNDVRPMKDKPLWPLASYGPAKYEPTLITGLDECPEELRVRAMMAMKANNVAEYVSYETTKFSAAEDVFANARNNITQTYEQARQLSQSTTFGDNTATAAPSAFGVPATRSVFGAPATTSAFGASATTSAFGTPATTSAFGAPATTSAFGAPATTSAFGAPATTSAFGAPATTSAFGKPAFGQPAFGQPAFGAAPPAATAPVSAFGQPAFGQPTQPQAATSAFGQTSQPQSSLIKPASGAFSAFAGTGVSAFGSGAPAAGAGSTAAPSGGAFSTFAGQQPSVFGAGAGGGGGNAISTPQTGGSVFGQSAFGSTSAAPAASAFGGGVATAPTTSVFAGGAAANPAAPATSVFGGGTGTTTSVFGQPAFGQPSLGIAAAPAANTGATPSASGSVFGPGGSASGGAFSNTAPSTSPFDTSSQPPVSVFGKLSPQQQPVSAFAPNQPPKSAFGSQPSMDQSSGSSGFTAIPMAPPPPSASGPPNFAAAKAAKNAYKPGSTPYDQTLAANYMSLLPTPALAAFQSEKFEWGKVPEWVPPLEMR